MVTINITKYPKKCVLVLAVVLFPSKVMGQDHNDFIRTVMESAETAKKAQEVVTNLGLNCADYANIKLFLSELQKALRGLSRVMAESGLQLATKHDYPTACHVLTKAQIAAYTEGVDSSHHSLCLSKDPFGGCLVKQNTKIEQPHPQYYWPKYFIEVNEKGNDSHPKFAARNGLYTASRGVAKAISGAMDKNGALKITAFVLGGKHALGALGIEVGSVDTGDLMQTSALTPFEDLRVRGSRHKTLTTFEANIWPVGLSETIAEHFSVCGPILKEQGKSPGGYSWPFKGVPMTCPVAMSRDAAPFWDTGMLDYLDPQAVAQMAVASNPISCGVAAAMDALGAMGGASREKIGDQGPANNATSGMSQDWRQALVGCSLPILGSAEALAKKAITAMDSAKWQGPYCTLWGSLAPRMSSGLFGSDYAYANAGIKFKTMAHELFGVPRGDAERWSLAYPWEGPGSTADAAGRAEGFAAFTNQISVALKGWGIPYVPTQAKSRSEALLRPGDPLLVDMSYTSRYWRDVVANRTAEFGYIAGLGVASVASRGEAIRQLKNSGGSPSGEAAVGVAAAAAPWVTAEILRARKGEMGGTNILPGDRRIFTVWEKVQCTSPSKRLTISTGPVTVKKYESCQAAIRFEVYKYIQKELLRKVCDWTGATVGKPWK
jgi:hypothetical protein